MAGSGGALRPRRLLAVWALRQPSEGRIRSFLEEQRGEPFTYPEAGCTRDLGSVLDRRPPVTGSSELPAGYDVDHESVPLGRGPEVWEAACAAIREWTMFPSPLTRVAHPFGPARTPPPVEEGTTVAMIVQAFGIHWVNACRIVYVIDEGERGGEAGPRRFGFAYGTLPGHVERGEERFLVEQDGHGGVHYDLLAFSRPRAWVVRLGYPFARALQRRFRIESLAAMKKAVTVGSPREEVS